MNIALGIKNRFFLIVTPCSIEFDAGNRRYVYQWLSGEDGITPMPWNKRFYSFIRPFRY